VALDGRVLDAFELPATGGGGAPEPVDDGRGARVA
jgi:hypothetical protein